MSTNTKPVIEEELSAQFDLLADHWEKETAIFSAPGQIYLNENYQTIISKGLKYPHVIIPLILERLASRGGDWFFALEQIAGENPAENCDDYESAITAWRNWASRMLR